MNYAAWLFFGTFLTFASAWLGLVFFPDRQLRDLEPAPITEGTTETFPKAYGGLEAAGRDVYVAEGCVYCHTQQIRGGRFQADIERGWGPRRTYPQDYIHDNPVLAGTMRTGPDLTNIGVRQPSADWHLKHLYDPQITSPGSIMAPYAHLFEVRRIDKERSPEALDLPEAYAPPPGWEVVPTERAKNLVAYLKSLDRTYPFDPVRQGVGK